MTKPPNYSCRKAVFFYLNHECVQSLHFFCLGNTYGTQQNNINSTAGINNGQMISPTNVSNIADTHIYSAFRLRLTSLTFVPLHFGQRFQSGVSPGSNFLTPSLLCSVSEICSARSLSFCLSYSLTFFLICLSNAVTSLFN